MKNKNFSKKKKKKKNISILDATKENHFLTSLFS